MHRFDDFGFDAGDLDGHALDADQASQVRASQFARSDGFRANGTSERHAHPHVAFVVAGTFLAGNVVGRAFQGANVSQRVAQEGVGETSVVGANVREGDAQTRMTDGRSGRGG